MRKKTRFWNRYTITLAVVLYLIALLTGCPSP